MIGLAQKLFTEKYQRSVPCSREKSSTRRSWPRLAKMLTEKRLSHVDYAFAESLLRHYPDANEEVAALLCHLSAASRIGHLCVAINPLGISPDPACIWLKDFICQSNEADDEKAFQMLREMIRQGKKMLPEGLVSDVSWKLKDGVVTTPLCRVGEHFYFQRNWLHETLFFRHYKRLVDAKPMLELNMEYVGGEARRFQEQKILFPEQAEAIVKVCQNAFTVITGGPGTGKTYTAAHLLKIFLEAIPKEKKNTCEIVLAAPTGKAVTNLQTNLLRDLCEFQESDFLTVKTLHSLLGIHRREEEKQMLKADLILVDESSMIDLKVMASLFRAVKTGARLVLLGDKSQLLPVESGALFSDLVSSHLLQNSNASPVVELKTCVRIEKEEVFQFANAAKEGDHQKAFQLIGSEQEHSGISFLKVEQLHENPLFQQNQLIEHALENFPVSYDFSGSPELMLEVVTQFRMLSPLRQGPFGVEEINQKILNAFLRKRDEKKAFIVPIIVARNDYRLELFNGDLGVLVQEPSSREKCQKASSPMLSRWDYALFPLKNEKNGFRKLSPLFLPKYEYAYCLSVHKSQGSEFDHVFLILPRGAEIFGREALYTAATRTKKRLTIWGEEDTLEKMIVRHSHRVSGIPYRFAER